MVTCPNCGAAVRESQRFCGTCGTDVPAALAAAAPSSRATAPMSGEQSSPYAYQSESGYGQSQVPYSSYDPSFASPPPAGGRMMIIAGAIILALCCAFACGLIFGFELIPDLLGMGASTPVPPRPTSAPTPSSLLPVIRYFIG